jgi:hypothetical protein
MQSIKFDDGFKEFMINDDPSRVIRFNPADYGIIERFDKARKEIAAEVDKIQEDINIKPDGSAEDDLGEAADLLDRTNKLIRDKIDYIFDSQVSDIAFGRQSPLSSVKGLPLFERFIRAAQPYIEKEVRKEQEASQKRISKYTSQVK